VSRRGEICINDPNILGRLVKYIDKFYYVYNVDKEIIKIKNKEGEQQINKNEINKIEPYNYDNVIISLLSLFIIILKKEYLYNVEDNMGYMGKMEIIKDIIEILNRIKTPQPVETL